MAQSRNLSGCQFFRAENLPLDWDCVPLKERLELLYGRALCEEDRRPGEIDVFGSNGKVGTHNGHWLEAPGILVGRKGTVGAVHYAGRAFWPIDTVYYVKPIAKDQLRYLYYLLNYLPLAFLNAATGVPGLSRRDAYALRGAFPPFDEQAAIACILDAVDTAIEQTREAVERARTLDHSLLHDLLEHGLGEGRSDKRPVHWEIKRVSEIAEVGSGVTMGKDVSGFKSVELPYLRVANVQDGHLDLSTIKTVRVRCDEVDHYRLKAGDVLMTEGGDLDKLGRGTLWEGQIPDCLHQNHIFRVRVNRKVLDPRFFSYVVESDIAKRYFIRVAKRTTNLASTNKTQVRAFRFPVPPLPEQQQIVAIVAAAKAKLQALMQKEVALQQLKKSLMHDLLTGKVRVGDSGLSPLP
ncbi:MAG: restriction endonuclease subunit S [Candidatus Contendobacter sp.]|nr:restriction endonuclease subunit S [Candidatus Contendobacter sp.]